MVAAKGGADVAGHGSGGDAGGGEDGRGQGQRFVRIGGREERRNAVAADAFILEDASDSVI